MIRLPLAIILCTASAFAEQALSVGVLGGAPFTDVVDATTSGTLNVVPKSANFSIGGVVQVNLPASFRIEGDALYRPYSYSRTTLGSIVNISAAQWRFPVLLQYRLGKSRLAPFVGAGLSFDHLSNISAAANAVTSGPGTLLQQSHAGAVMGAGIDIKAVLVRISAELRYTHQGSADFQSLSKLNQTEFLLGIHF